MIPVSPTPEQTICCLRMTGQSTPLCVELVLYTNVCLHADGLRKRLQAAVHLQ